MLARLWVPTYDMRALIQRVSEASVTVDGKQVSSIGAGLLVLLGVGKGDTEKDADWLADKVVGLRIFSDAAGKMNLALTDTSKALIAVSQFTLFGDVTKGKRPSFIDACEPEEANRLYQYFCERCRALGVTVGTGIFRAEMKVAFVNDGPVTLWVDSRS
jgi:D-aminoacyl-tRNA deacylase